MRNTTKLKAILLKYRATFEMNDDEFFTMTLTDKNFGNNAVFQAPSYSLVVGKAYAHLLRELKAGEASEKKHRT
jgi:hypothetical protein